MPASFSALTEGGSNRQSSIHRRAGSFAGQCDWEKVFNIAQIQIPAGRPFLPMTFRTGPLANSVQIHQEHSACSASVLESRDLARAAPRPAVNRREQRSLTDVTTSPPLPPCMARRLPIPNMEAITDPRVVVLTKWIRNVVGAILRLELPREIDVVVTHDGWMPSTRCLGATAGGGRARI